MPQYVTKALKQFNHKLQKKQHQPYPSTPIIYGANNQYATPQSTAPLLDRKGKKFFHQVCGKFLFLGRAVDITSPNNHECELYCSTIVCPKTRDQLALSVASLVESFFRKLVGQ